MRSRKNYYAINSHICQQFFSKKQFFYNRLFGRKIKTSLVSKPELIQCSAQHNGKFFMKYNGKFAVAMCAGDYISIFSSHLRLAITPPSRYSIIAPSILPCSTVRMPKVGIRLSRGIEILPGLNKCTLPRPSLSGTCV